MPCLSYPSQMYGNSSVISITTCWRLVPSQLRGKYRRRYLPDAFEHAFYLVREIVHAIRKADVCVCVCVCVCHLPSCSEWYVPGTEGCLGGTTFNFFFWWGGGRWVLVLFVNMWQGPLDTGSVRRKAFLHMAAQK